MNFYLITKVKIKCYRFKNCLQKYIAFLILVTIFWTGFFLDRHVPSVNSFHNLEMPVASVNKLKKIPYSVSPILHDHQYTSTSRKKAYASRSVYATAISYFQYPASLTGIFMATKEDLIRREEEKQELSEFSDFYSYIKRPKFHCGKLVRMGGQMDCKGNVLHSQMDGHKLICMDPQMELKPRKNPSACLTLSFGINYDVTFDEAMAMFNCEVHMFDPVSWKLGYTVSKPYPYTHVHVSALGAEDLYHFYPNMNNYSVGVFTLQTHIFDNGLQYRPLHILKIDIENHEWEVLKENLLKGSILDTVGQIAMEIHTNDLVLHLKNATTTEKLAALQEKYNILRALETYGFLPVSYWDNVQDTYAFYDNEGWRFETAGEILYINTKWYNYTFKQELLKNGIKLAMS